VFDKVLTLHLANPITFVGSNLKYCFEVLKCNSFYTQTDRAEGVGDTGYLPGGSYCEASAGEGAIPNFGNILFGYL
jgi:hypothetical protein